MGIKETNRLLGVYREAINKIDDYFEYTNESMLDRREVHIILDQLCQDLMPPEEEIDDEIDEAI